jgi:thiol-disulfide isomerase/thioredoxin
MLMRHSIGVVLVVANAVVAAQQAPRPVTLLSEVRAAIAAHDLPRAEALVSKQRADKGNTPEVLEAVSWLARGAQSEGQPDRAGTFAAEAQRLALAKLAGRPVDSDAQLAAAISNAIEVQAQVAAARGERSEAIAFLGRELQTYRETSLAKRIQKNINLLTLEGHPAPALDTSEWIGPARATLADVKGKVVVLFFWAHWCPDCKIQGPILAKLRERYRSQGLAIVAPTQRYGYVARGAAAPPDEELRYIIKIRDEYYPFLADLPVPLSVANHQRYGVSSTPTVVILDRQGMVRLYHPGRMTEGELDLQLRSLLDSH